MIDEKIKKMLEQALQKEHLWASVDQTESQFIDVGHPYAHLVLNDASAYEQVLETVKALKDSGASYLECLIRSKWQINSVEYQALTMTPMGTFTRLLLLGSN